MKVLVIGGAGYVGSMLVPKLLKFGHQVSVYDLYLFGRNVFDNYQKNSHFKEFVGDVRDLKKLENVLDGHDAIIHLACLSNDPSYELDPQLSKSINFDCFEPLVKLAKDKGIKRFIYASSSSVYGVKEENEVTEQMSLEPLTEYSKYKALCEEVLFKYADQNFITAAIRPATVCGYAPRQRLDVVVNILTNLAYHTGNIKIMGGEQKRPNIHIKDMVRAYIHLLEEDPEKIQKKVFNVGAYNHRVKDLGEMIRRIVGEKVSVEVIPSNDPRSYHISSKKIEEELGFKCKYTIEDAVKDLLEAFKENRISDPLNNKSYYNIEVIKNAGL